LTSPTNKANTLNRRITRRMVLNKSESPEAYAKFMRENAAEVEALYQDILINVTSFFRNPETFAVLKEKIFPQIAEQHTSDEPIRIGRWLFDGRGSLFDSHVLRRVCGRPGGAFAGTDFRYGSERPWHREARADFIHEILLRMYHRSACGDFSRKRTVVTVLVSHSATWLVFARQNVISDPPFSRLDLISCRNLLIYLEPVLQKHVLPILHYALKPTGVLWLGSSETPGSSSDLFCAGRSKAPLLS